MLYGSHDAQSWRIYKLAACGVVSARCVVFCHMSTVEGLRPGRVRDSTSLLSDGTRLQPHGPLPLLHTTRTSAPPACPTAAYIVTITLSSMSRPHSMAPTSAHPTPHASRRSPYYSHPRQLGFVPRTHHAAQGPSLALICRSPPLCAVPLLCTYTQHAVMHPRPSTAQAVNRMHARRLHDCRCRQTHRCPLLLNDLDALHGPAHAGPHSRVERMHACQSSTVSVPRNATVVDCDAQYMRVSNGQRTATAERRTLRPPAPLRRPGHDRNHLKCMPVAPGRAFPLVCLPPVHACHSPRPRLLRSCGCSGQSWCPPACSEPHVATGTMAQGTRRDCAPARTPPHAPVREPQHGAAGAVMHG